MNNRIVYTSRETKKRSKKKSEKPFLVAGIAFFFILLSAGLIVFASMSKWRISHVQVEGLKILSGDEVRKNIFGSMGGNTAFLLPRSSIWLLNSSAIRSSLFEEFPRIKSVELKRSYPNGIFVSIEERDTWGVLCGEALPDREAPCVYIDTTGYAMESAPNSTGSLILKIKTDFPSVKENSHIIGPSLASRMIFLLEETKRKIEVDTVGFELSSRAKKEIRLVTNEGFTIIFLREDNFENTFSVLKKVLEEEIKDRRSRLEYIDLRFGNKVFFKLK